MAIQYYVRTWEPLPTTKRFFACDCKKDEYINQIKLDYSELGEEVLKNSINTLEIDDEVLPNYRKFFYEEKSRRPFKTTPRYA